MKSLNRIELIRTSFATHEMNLYVESKGKKVMGVLGTYWITLFGTLFVCRVL
jgi:hypothetical protein